MRRFMGIAAAVLAGAVSAGCCYYSRPPLEERYDEIVVDMDKQDVISILGEPTLIQENEMMYLYDDPVRPVRYRFVLDQQGVVIAKYYETKADLAKKAQEVKTRAPVVQPLPEEREAGRPYPGGPLPLFEKKKQP